MVKSPAPLVEHEVVERVRGGDGAGPLARRGVAPDEHVERLVACGPELQVGIGLPVDVGPRGGPPAGRRSPVGEPAVLDQARWLTQTGDRGLGAQRRGRRAPVRRDPRDLREHAGPVPVEHRREELALVAGPRGAEEAHAGIQRGGLIGPLGQRSARRRTRCPPGRPGRPSRSRRPCGGRSRGWRRARSAARPPGRAAARGRRSRWSRFLASFASGTGMNSSPGWRPRGSTISASGSPGCVGVVRVVGVAEDRRPEPCLLVGVAAVERDDGGWCWASGGGSRGGGRVSGPRGDRGPPRTSTGWPARSPSHLRWSARRAPGGLRSGSARSRARTPAM